MVELDDIVREFLVESTEGLDQLDRDFVTLEQQPDDPDVLARVFRCIHTIKGTCGFLGFSSLAAVTHEGESLLSLLRDGTLRLTPELTTVLLRLVDAVRTILTTIEATGSDAGHDFQDLIATLANARAPKPKARKGRRPRRAAPSEPAGSPQDPSHHSASPATATPPAVVHVAATDGVVDQRVALRVRFDEDPAMEPDTLAMRSADDHPVDMERRRSDDRRSAIADTSLRVGVSLLDKLMNLVGELVLARNQILQFNTVGSDSAFVGATQRLNLVTSELQEGVMKTRMQPIDTVWSKFPRVVRDLATACGKQVRLEMHGKDTELDKTIIEAIKDPLTHVVRNSADHGIEAPDVRIARGKDPEGVVTLRAFHEGGQINIEITDDGAGIDPEHVRRKAVARGMVTTEQAARLTDTETLRMIFLPGFSTAEAITEVSGRGVGMDVVKTNIEKIGGTVDVQSSVGHGTTLKIRIPLTLAIIPALMVSTGGELFAIPQVSLLELVRLTGEQSRTGIERINGATFHRLRGNLLPLVDLHRELGLVSHNEADVVNIVVLKAEDRQFGMVVDAVNDAEEIVVKPLGKQLKSVQVFAGATIMGDGHVALILDVTRLAQQARVLTEVRDRTLGARESVGARHDTEDAQTWLLFQANGTERMAIPLRLVARLEEFATSHIERSGGLEVVQYRNEILPLISLTRFFGGTTSTDESPRQAIVFADRGRSVGLVVDQILDIVTQTISTTRTHARPGILGSAVIQQRVTDLLDVPAIVHIALPQDESEPVAA